MTKRRLITKLPGILQTPDLKKFFSATVDQVFQPGETQSVNAFVGKKPSYFNASKDFYKPELSADREFYQLEPAMTTTANDGSIGDILFYQDAVNNLRFQGALVNNESRLFNTEFYSWCPPVNVSKLEKYRDYYWIPEGPPVLVFDIPAGGDETITHTGNDHRTIFAFPTGIPGKKARVEVMLNGLVVNASKYTIVGNAVVMGVAPVQGTTLSVRTLGGYLVSSDSSGNVVNRFQLPRAIGGVDAHNLIVKVNGNLVVDGYILAGDIANGKSPSSPIEENTLETYITNGGALVFHTPLMVNDVVEIWVNGDYLKNIQGKSNYVHPAAASAYATEHITEQYLDAQGNVQIREILKQYPVKSVPTPLSLTQNMRVKIIDDTGTMIYTVNGTNNKLLLVPSSEQTTLREKTPQYITIERGASSMNGWSTRNNWYHKSTLVYGDTAYQPIQAARPIVEYFNSLMVYNLGRSMRSVDLICDNNSFDTVKWNNTQTTGSVSINHDSFTDNAVAANSYITLVREERADTTSQSFVTVTNKHSGYDEEFEWDTHRYDGSFFSVSAIAAPNLHEQVQVESDPTQLEYVFKPYLDKNALTGKWVVAATFNYQEPLFDLFDGPVDEETTKSLSYYPDNNFNGSKLFSYERTAGTVDPILGIPVSRNKYGLIEFRDHIATDVWTSNGDEIAGYKYFAQRNLSNNSYALTYRNNWYAAGTTTQEKIGDFYEIPRNLQANATNQEVEVISPNDWQKQFKSLLSGSDWTIDSSQFNLAAGTSIIQTRGTMLKTMLLNADTSLDFIKASMYVEHEYLRYRNKFVQLLKQWELQGSLIDVEFGVQGILNQLKSAKTIDFPFYNSGVVGDYFIPATAAFLGMTPLGVPAMTLEVGRSGAIILIRGHDGSVISGFTRASKRARMENGVIIDIVNTTVTNPETGFVTVIEVEEVFSIDNKDLALFNLENKIYESASIKLKGNRRPVFDLTASMSGKFRTREYSRDDYIVIARPMFERWAIRMNLNYRTNKNYDNDNPFTYNYRDLLDHQNKAVPGFWRGMYLYFFDTDRPHTHPWEMLGFTSKPWMREDGTSAWDDAYSWTDDSKRQALVTALTMGLVSRPGAIPDELDPTFARSGFASVNPVAADGSLLDPLAAGIVVNKGVVAFSKDWAFGDVGPTEYQWKTSQSSSFTQAQIAYLMKPVQFIESSWETSDEVLIHNYNWVSKGSGKRKQTKDYIIHNELVNGKPTRVLGLQLWLSDYLRSLGKDVTTTLGDRVRALGANLAHKLGGFIDSASLKTFTENSGLIPQEDVKVLTYQSPSIREEFYGGAIITWTGNSWKAIGYDVSNQAFSILPVDESGGRLKLTLSESAETFATDWHQNTYYPVNVLVQLHGTNYRCSKTHTSSRLFEAEYWVVESQVSTNAASSATYFLEHDTTPVKIAYGYEMFSIQEVVNFLSGYEAYLISRGWDFDYLDTSVNQVRDFKYSAKEFMSWAQVKWAPNTFIALSPSSQSATFKTSHGTIQSVDQMIHGSYAVLSKEGSAVTKSNVTADRTDDGITVSVKDDAIYGLRLSINEVEQVIVFRNVTTFNDVLYQPLFDLRQNRIRIVALLSTDWQGKLDAPGFIVTDNRMLPSFEKQVEDIRNMYDIEKTINLPLRDNARHQIGYQSRPYLEKLMYNEVNQFEFYQGMIQQKGAPGVFDKLLRNDDLTQSQELSFLDEWAFRKGIYGGVEKDSTFEIEFARQNVVTEPQLVKFSNSEVIPAFPLDSTIIEMYNNKVANDTRIIRPYSGDTPFTQSQVYTRAMNDLPNAGYARVNETDWQSMNFASFKTEVANSLSDLENGQRLWIYENEAKRWSIFRVSSPLNINAFYPDENGVRIVFDAIPTVSIGEMVYLNKVINENSDIGGMVTVLSIDAADQSIVIAGDVLSKHEYTSTDVLPQMFRLTDMRVRIVDSTLAQKYVLEAKTTISLAEVIADLKIGITDSYLDGEHLYFDVGFEIQSLVPSTGKHWKVFTFNALTQTFNVSRVQPQRLRSDLIKDIKVYDTTTKVTKSALTVKPVLNTDIVVFDPVKGLIPGVADKEIWYKLEYDPANYNRGLGVNSQGADWNQDQIGRLWWNVSTTRFLQTETDDLDTTANAAEELSYRRNYHGKLAPNTSIDIYEWTQSRVLPIKWTKNVEQSVSPDVFNGTVLNADEPAWVESTIWDDSLAQYTPVYYFWVKDRTITPMVDFRQTPAIDVAHLISNPEKAGLSWVAPISKTAFLINGITPYLNITSSLQFRVARTESEVLRHVEWDIMRKGDERSLPTRELWNKITKSLSTYTTSGATLPDMNRYATDRVGFDVENGQSLFNNTTNARKHMVQYLNSVFAKILLVDERRDITSLVSSDANLASQQWYQKEGSYYVAPYPSESMYDAKFNSYEAFDEFVQQPANASKVGLVTQITEDFTFWSLMTKVNGVSSLWSLFSVVTNDLNSVSAALPAGTRVKVLGSIDTGNFWTIWEKNSDGAFDLVTTQRYQTTDVFAAVDWYATGYAIKDEPVYVYDTVLDRDQQLGVDPRFTLVKITNDGKGRWMWTAFLDGKWTTVAKQNGTIALLDNVWANTGNYLPVMNTLPANFKALVGTRDMGYEIDAFLNTMRDYILTDIEVNNLFFSMVDYAHTEQNYIDWCFKTSFMYVTGYTEKLLQDPIALSDRTGNLLSYINEVKPYHVKIRDFASKYGVSDIAKVHVTDFDFPAYFDPTINKFRQLIPSIAGDLAIIKSGVWNDWLQQYQNNDNKLVRKMNLTIGRYAKYDKDGELIIAEHSPEQIIDEDVDVLVSEGVRIRVYQKSTNGAPTMTSTVVHSTNTINVTMDLVAQTQSAVVVFNEGYRVDPELVTFDAAASRVTAPIVGSKHEVVGFSYGSTAKIRNIVYFTKTDTVNQFDLVDADLSNGQLMVTVNGIEVAANLQGSVLTVPTTAGNGLVQVAILDIPGETFARITSKRFTKAEFTNQSLPNIYAPMLDATRQPIMNNFIIEVDGLRKMTDMIYDTNINASNPMIRLERNAPVTDLQVTLDDVPVVVGTNLTHKYTIPAADREVNIGQMPALSDIHVTDALGNPLIVGELRYSIIPLNPDHPFLYPSTLHYDIDVYDTFNVTWDGVALFGPLMTLDTHVMYLNGSPEVWESFEENSSLYTVYPVNADLALYAGHLVHMPKMDADLDIIVSIKNLVPIDFAGYNWIPQDAPFVMIDGAVARTDTTVNGHLVILDKVGGELDINVPVDFQYPNAQLITITDIVDSDMGTRSYTFRNAEQLYFPINQYPANKAALWVNVNGRRLTHLIDYVIVENLIGDWDKFSWDFNNFDSTKNKSDYVVVVEHMNQEWDEFVWDRDEFESTNYITRGNVKGTEKTLAIKFLVDLDMNDIIIATVFAAPQAREAKTYEIFTTDNKVGNEVREIRAGDIYTLTQAMTATSTSIAVSQNPSPYTHDVIDMSAFDNRVWIGHEGFDVKAVNNDVITTARNEYVNPYVAHDVLARIEAPRSKPNGFVQ